MESSEVKKDVPRTLRIQAAGAYYLVVARGTHPVVMFHDDDEWRFFLNALG